MTSFVRQDVERLPENPVEHVLYVSHKFEMTLHRCACGCGHKVFTFLGDGHEVIGHQNSPTVIPSIGVWDAKCRSHYFIERGKVVWASKFSEEKIAISMRRQLERHIASTSKPTFDNTPWYIRLYRRVFK